MVEMPINGPEGWCVLDGAVLGGVRMWCRPGKQPEERSIGRGWEKGRTWLMPVGQTSALGASIVSLCICCIRPFDAVPLPSGICPFFFFFFFSPSSSWLLRKMLVDGQGTSR